jgi:AraC-like DNA-binding protein
MCYLTHLCLSLVRIMSQNLSEQSKPDILFSCYSTVSKEGEQFVANHVLSFGLEGSSSLFMNGLHYSSGEGDFRFIKRNQLAKFIKYPSAGGEYKSISVSIDQGTLHALSKEYGIYAEHQFGNEGVVKLEANPLLQNFKSSIIPYLNNSGELNSMIISLKVKEAVLILLQTNPALKDTLFDFSDPGKIDLEAYMTANYKYNVSLERFAFLTGRSVATFKRDFKRIFGSTPNRWLQQKRLSEAYYLLQTKKWKTTEVYTEVGFKDISHFSYAFKKAYGTAPSMLYDKTL